MWPRRDSNTQPSDLESDALPLRHAVIWKFSTTKYSNSSKTHNEKQLTHTPADDNDAPRAVDQVHVAPLFEAFRVRRTGQDADAAVVQYDGHLRFCWMKQPLLSDFAVQITNHLFACNIVKYFNFNFIKINKNLLNNTRHSTNIFLFKKKKCQHWAAPEIVAMATVCVRLRPIQWQPIRLSASDTDLVINVMAWSNQPWRHHFNPLSSINLGNILAIE